MRNLARTAAVIASIAVAIVLLFMAPKGFELSAPNPIVAGQDVTFTRNVGGHGAPRYIGQGG